MEIEFYKMLLAIDVKYNDNNTAKAIGVLFNWEDETPQKVITKYIKKVKEYIPGQFYKRELPCIQEVIKEVNLSEIEIIIVDGHVYVDNHNSYGLGGYAYQEYDEKIPVVGVAKSPFYANKEAVIEVFRGESKYPLYISSIGIDKGQAAEKVRKMKGNYRIPTIFKTLDRLTKENISI